jgi:hypothetical protein
MDLGDLMQLKIQTSQAANDVTHLPAIANINVSPVTPDVAKSHEARGLFHNMIWPLGKKSSIQSVL